MDDLPAQVRDFGKRFIQNYQAAGAQSPPSTPTDNALTWIQRARRLNTQLLDSNDLPDKEKWRMAREVEGSLFAAESKLVASNRARMLFFRLRTLVHLAALRGSALRRNGTIWMDYEELLSLAERASDGETDA